MTEALTYNRRYPPRPARRPELHPDHLMVANCSAVGAPVGCVVLPRYASKPAVGEIRDVRSSQANCAATGRVGCLPTPPNVAVQSALPQKLVSMSMVPALWKTPREYEYYAQMGLYTRTGQTTPASVHEVGGDLVNVMNGMGDAVAFADVNNDGRIDMAIRNQLFFNLPLDYDARYGHASSASASHIFTFVGLFVPGDIPGDPNAFPHDVQSFVSSLAFGDLDGDGDQDLVVGKLFGQWQLSLRNTGYNAPNLILLNDGTGNFTVSIGNGFSHASEPVTREVVLGDVDNDGDLDIFCANFQRDTDSYETGNERPNYLYFNDGTGNFTIDLTNLVTTSTSYRSMAAAFGDIDGDVGSRPRDMQRTRRVEV